LEGNAAVLSPDDVPGKLELNPAGAPSQWGSALVVPDADGVVSADIVIVGSGMGGSTLAWALRQGGASVLVVERGHFLPRERENWSPQAVFADGRYKNAEQWSTAAGKRFDPGVYYYVGGNTKLFGAMLPRFREQDFGVVEHRGGTSPAWPIAYADLEPFYAEAERLYRVHGDAGADPTEPWRSGPYPYPALQHEPRIQQLADSLAAQGLTPFAMPAAVDVGPEGRCVLCRTCDGYPCMVDAKGDADVFALRPALRSGRVRLLTGTTVTRLLTSPGGRTVVGALGERDGAPVQITAGRFVLACGAVNTAALLLHSAGPNHPAGLANGSGQLGRNYMVHNSTFFVGVDPRRPNDTMFQKTLAFNDWYLASRDLEYPLGNVQMLGKLQAPMVKAARRWTPYSALDWGTRHSVDLYITSEDLPTADNRITLDERGGIVVSWTPNNLDSHEELVRRTSRLIRRAGFPIISHQRMGVETNSHQCGTAVMGDDPAASVVDPLCRAHELDNLWIADSAPFVSSAAVNPALTIAANALRVAATSGLSA
jgi:choline dehydrogenase-like flavoprotein